MVKNTRAYKWAEQQTKRALKIDFVRFGMVGVVGFLVSEIVLFLLFEEAGLVRWLSFALSNEAGLLATFTLHEVWTYKHLNHQHKSLLQKIGHFHLSAWSGIAIIIGIGLVSVHVLGVNVFVGQALGSGVAMFWNFFWTRYFIFKGKTPAVLAHPEDIAKDDE